MNFQTYGPFKVEVQPNGLIGKNQAKLWEEANKMFTNLPEAKGCYVFGIRRGGQRIVPWYVGKTNRQSFRNEWFTADKLSHYNNSFAGKMSKRKKKGNSYLYFVPKFTKKGRLYKGNSSSGIDFLEKYLIGLAITANKDLKNTMSTKPFRQITYPGFLNNPRGSLSKSSIELRLSLKIEK